MPLRNKTTPLFAAIQLGSHWFPDASQVQNNPVVRSHIPVDPSTY
nr:hypothetical protein [Klebsiella oxytoca]